MIDLLETLALVLLHFPLLVGMGLDLTGVCSGCHCRVTVPGPCDACTGDLVPQYQIVITGMVDSLCANCSDLDGTYITDLSGCTSIDLFSTTAEVYGIVDDCPALGTPGCAVASSADISVIFTHATIATPFVTIVTSRAGSLLSNVYRWTGSSPLDCTSFVDEPFTFSDQFGACTGLGGVGTFTTLGCDASAATCEVSVV